jgi:hypothetical protein
MIVAHATWQLARASAEIQHDRAAQARRFDTREVAQRELLANAPRHFELVHCLTLSTLHSNSTARPAVEATDPPCWRLPAKLR